MMLEMIMNKMATKIKSNKKKQTLSKIDKTITIKTMENEDDAKEDNTGIDNNEDDEIDRQISIKR